jgi:iron complex transport system substrate-binding protein
MRGTNTPKKTRRLLCGGLLTALLIAALLYSPLFAVEVTDALGRELTFGRPPQRIVVAGRGLLMVVDALYLFPEAPYRVIAFEKITLGRANFLSVVDPFYDSKTVLPIDVGAERIASLKPDVVLMKSYMRRKLGSSLETLGIPVVYLNFETPAQYERDIGVLGLLLGNEARSGEIKAYFRDRMRLVEKRIERIAEKDRPRVLFLYYSERGGSRAFNVPPATWMQTMLVEKAGGIPVWKNMRTGQGWTRVSFEQIASWDADHVFITSYFLDVDEVKERLMNDELWQSLRALQQGNIHAFPADYYNWDLPDPRWILGLTWLASKLHPECFGDVDMNSETRTFFRELYFLDDAGYNRYIETVLHGDLP